MLDRAELLTSARKRQRPTPTEERAALLRRMLCCTRRTYSRQESYAACTELLTRSGDWNLIMSPSVSAEVRAGLAALYAVARLSDDIVDELRDQAEREAALMQWSDAVHRALHEKPDHPVLTAFLDTAERCAIPYVHLDSMVAAAQSESDLKRLTTFEHLQQVLAGWCWPLGRCLLSIFGERNPALLRYADDLFVGLRLLTLLFKLREDYTLRKRIYLPQSELWHFGVREQELDAAAASPSLRELIRALCGRAQSLLDRGRPLLRLVGQELRGELLVTLDATEQAAACLRRREFDTLAVPSGWGHAELPGLVGRAFSWAQTWTLRPVSPPPVAPQKKGSRQEAARAFLGVLGDL
ncbi:MAG: squalene/phytoene synthase family protein [Polyangia bacterium]